MINQIITSNQRADTMDFADELKEFHSYKANFLFDKKNASARENFIHGN